MEHVVEIGVFGYVDGEFGDTFPTLFRPFCGHHGEIIVKTILNHKTFYVWLVVYIVTVRMGCRLTKFGQELIDWRCATLIRANRNDKAESQYHARTLPVTNDIPVTKVYIEIIMMKTPIFGSYERQYSNLPSPFHWISVLKLRSDVVALQCNGSAIDHH
jgi:hypothetical protein